MKRSFFSKRYLVLLFCICGIYGFGQEFNEYEFIERYEVNKAKRDFITIKSDFIRVFNEEALTNEQKMRLYLLYARFCKNIDQYEISLNYLNKAFHELDGKNVPKYRQEIFQIKAYTFFDWFELNSTDPIDKIRSDSAKFYVSKLLEDYSTLADSELIYINNISAHYEYEAGNYKKAERIFDANIVSQKKHTPCELPLTYVKKMRLYNKMDDTLKLNRAYSNSLESIELCNESNYLEHTYEVMYEIQSERKNYKQALQSLLLAAKIKDSLADRDKMIKIDELDRKYQSQLKDEIISSQNQRENSLAVIISLLVLGLLLAYWVLRRNRKQALLLKQNNKTIEKSLKEKELLVKEVHHRVKNNFQIVSSLLELQSKSIEDEKSLGLAKEGQNRVKSMALIHQKLYQNDGDLIDFDEYIRLLIMEINRLFQSKRKVNTEIISNGIHLDVDTAIPLGLIINELITNAYKHAFDKREGNELLVSINYLFDGQYKLTVSDNGKGLSESIDLSKTESLGLRLVTRLTKQLHGTLEQTNDNGARFEIIFKDTSARKTID